MVIFRRLFGADGTETEHDGDGLVLAPVVKGSLTLKCQTNLAGDCSLPSSGGKVNEGR